MSAMTRSFRLLVVAVAVSGLVHQGCKDRSSGPPPSGGPVITQLDPDHGPAGASVTIRGQNFETDDRLNSVFFGSVQAAARSSRTTEVVVDVPGGVVVGTVPVTISTRAGTSSAAQFRVDPQGPGAPSLSSVSPQTGAVGARVTLQGTGFATNAAANTITFNGVQAQVLSATASTLETQVPNGATSGPVAVRTSAGVSNGVTFTVTSNTPVGQGASGSMGRDYLAAVPYSSMLVEVDYIQGQAPDQDALNFLRTRLNERCNKPGGITIQVSDAIPDQGITTWRRTDIERVEARYRNSYHAGNTAVLYFLYVNGGSEWDSGNGRVLGVSHTGSSICMFKESMRGSVTVLITGQAIERAVLVHEAGHNLGLVDNGTPMVVNHEDAGHQGHDQDQGCVMYWAVETSLVSQLLGSIPDQFCARCIDDMRAVGGR